MYNMLYNVHTSQSQSFLVSSLSHCHYIALVVISHPVSVSAAFGTKSSSTLSDLSLHRVKQELYTDHLATCIASTKRLINLL